MHKSPHPDEATTLLHRMVFFSDAVFAIILTLLALELRPPVVPVDQLFDALINMAPNFGAFAISFGVIGIFWVAHLSTFRRLVHFDWWVTVFNLLLLFVLALIPFTAGLVGEFGQAGPAWQVYCAVLVAASLAQTAVLLALYRGGGHLVGGVSLREVIYRMIRAISPGLAFGAGLGLSLAGHDGLAGVCWVLIAPIMLLARVLHHAPKRKPAAA